MDLDAQSKLAGKLVKKISLFVLLLLLVAATALGCDSSEPVYNPAEFTTHTDTECGWSISYPSDSWKRAVSQCSIDILLPSSDYSSALAPWVQVQVDPTGLHDLQSGMSLREYVDLGLSDAALSGEVDSKTLSVEESMIGGLPAASAIWVEPGNAWSPSLKTMLVLIRREPVVARIWCCAEPDEFDRYAGLFEQIVGTFLLH
ncbi:MAG: hypothetical protein JSW38_04905 [Dehalococcoidia bacterium]|nr:MAG: hypothetical protein JSW38_04905 [Dehalococcoidia bacterium]